MAIGASGKLGFTVGLPANQPTERSGSIHAASVTLREVPSAMCVCVQVCVYGRVHACACMYMACVHACGCACIFASCFPRSPCLLPLPTLEQTKLRAVCVPLTQIFLILNTAVSELAAAEMQTWNRYFCGGSDTSPWVFAFTERGCR